MQFTRKGDYALRAMAYLAGVERDVPYTIDEIAGNSKVPRHFLAKILKDLTRANLLIAVKGAHGGYMLARRSSEISVLEVIEAAVGPMTLNICLGEQDRCPETATCEFYPVWKKAARAMLNVFETTKLSALHKR
jgi:Rrf2 family protein